MEEVDPDPVWSELRKVTRKLFRSLGALRDGQVMDEWVKKLAPETDAVRAHLHSASNPASRGCERTPFAAAKIDVKAGSIWKHTVRRRSRLVPTGSLAAECLALERFESAKELHAKALRTEKSKPWHALRIGLKRFRYTVEGLLPDQYAAWSDNLKRLQDILGEIHDLDVLAGKVNKSDHLDTEDSVRLWHETIERERHDRMETYRQLTLGHTSLWNIWRSGLPTNGRLEAAAMARLRVTARAIDPRPRRTSQISRIAVGFSMPSSVRGPQPPSPMFLFAAYCSLLLDCIVRAWPLRQVAEKSRAQVLAGTPSSPGLDSRRVGGSRRDGSLSSWLEPSTEGGAFSKLSWIIKAKCALWRRSSACTFPP